MIRLFFANSRGQGSFGSRLVSLPPRRFFISLSTASCMIDYRNVISHEMHNLLADISPERIAREMVAYAPDLQF
jgi:hypothetical protein